MTPSGIEPASFRVVAHWLNQVSRRVSPSTQLCLFNFPQIILPFSFIDVYFEVLFPCFKTPPKNKTSNVRYVPSNNITCSLTGHTSSAILTPWYHFTGRQSFYGDLISPASIKHTLVLTYGAGYFFFRDFHQVADFLEGFSYKRFQYQISRKYAQWDPCWYMSTDGDTDRRTWCA